jgi:hypothetical protein
MRQIYCRSFTVTFTTGDSGYVFAEKIDPGQILHVHACFAYAPEREANDNIVIGVRNGGQDIVLIATATLAVQRGANTPTDFFIGEGDQLYAYFPNVDNTDSIGIHINGVLMSREEWEDMPE